MSTPPEIDIEMLDFSEFHQIGDHWPFSSYCRTLYGGGRVHLAYAWEFRWRDAALWPGHRVLCSLGVHDGREGWERDPPANPDPGQPIPEETWERWRRDATRFHVYRCHWCRRYRVEPASRPVTT